MKFMTPRQEDSTSGSEAEPPDLQRPVMQFDVLREFAVRCNYAVVAEFVDHGASGARERRPALDKLMDAAANELSTSFSPTASLNLARRRPRISSISLGHGLVLARLDLLQSATNLLPPSRLDVGVGVGLEARPQLRREDGALARKKSQGLIDEVRESRPFRSWFSS